MTTEYRLSSSATAADADTLLAKAGTAVQPNHPALSDARTPLAHTQAASTITGLALVATTGNYNDLSNKPTDPGGGDGDYVDPNSIKRWGATGVTGSDATPALILAVANTASGGTITFPPGVYDVTMSGISLAGKSLTFEGIGDATINLTGSLAAAGVFSYKNSPRVVVKGIKFTRAGANPSAGALIFADATDGYTDYFSVTDCEFHGPIRLITGTGIDEDPMAVDYGFNFFEYARNKCFGLEYAHINFVNTPQKEGIIKDNVVRNWSYKFYNCTWSGGGANQYVAGAVTFENNRFICDNDYWHNTTLSGAYYAVAVIVAGTINLINNHTEGMKIQAGVVPADGNPPQELYDFYAFGRRVTSKNNVWKNNYNFNNSENAYLIHAKSEPFEGVEDPVKHYTHNLYLIEKSWVENLGKDPDTVKVKLFYCGTNATGDINIDRNTFSVMSLLHNGRQGYGHFRFTNNTILVRKTGNANLIEGWPSYSTSSAYINNNTFIAEEVAGEFKAFSHSAIEAVGRAIHPTFERFELCGNSFSGPSAGTEESRLIAGLKANNVVISDNRVNMAMREEFFNCDLKSLTAINNHFNRGMNSHIRVLYLTEILGQSEVVNKYHLRPGSVGFYLVPSTVPAEASTSYRVRLTFETSGGSNVIEFAYRVDYADSAYTLVWTDSGDAARSDTLLTDEGNNIVSQSVKSGNGPLALGVKLINSVTTPYFQITGLPAYRCMMTLELRSFV